jgi:MFS superfamily sulfate permease-like transporter|nr:MAG TPA: holin [Caudoviricetes sp.]
MDLSVLSQYLSVVVMGICLCVGYVIKNSLDFIPNKYIPAIMLVLGTTINILMNLNEINAEVILVGMLSGLASTGLYELFKNFINKEEK